MSDPDGAACATCVWWQRRWTAGGGVGVCRVNPPTLLLEGQEFSAVTGSHDMYLGTWPVTAGTDWCGRWSREWVTPA